MKRKYLPEYQSLSYLIDGFSSGNNLTPQARRGSYWRNTIKVRVQDGLGSGLLLNRDGYFVTNYHILTNERVRAGSTISIPEIDYQYPVSRVLVKSRLYDLVLAQARLTDASVPTEVVFSPHKPSPTERVRVYGYKHEVVEERQGSMSFLQDYSSFGAKMWRSMGVHRISNGLEDEAIRNTMYSTCEIELGWSGGPVVLESTGELIGFTKFIKTSSPNIEMVYGKHGFTSIKKLKEMIEYFLEKEE